MRRYVLDASVAFKWFVKARDETLIEEASRLLELYLATEVQLYVPDLFFAEFGNILWKAEWLSRCDRKTADAALAEILDRNLPTFPTSVLLKPAAAIARVYGRTIYDSLYLALASELDAPFLTADVKLVNSVRGQLPIVWLGAL